MNEPKTLRLLVDSGAEIAEILRRRANEIASYNESHKADLPGSVELALNREVTRLRRLVSEVTPDRPE